MGRGEGEMGAEMVQEEVREVGEGEGGEKSLVERS